MKASKLIPQLFTTLTLVAGCGEWQDPAGYDPDTYVPMIPTTGGVGTTGGTTAGSTAGSTAGTTAGSTAGTTGGDASATGEGDSGAGDGGTTGEGFRSAFTDVGVDAPLDYSVPQMWVCQPGIEEDECTKSLDATEIKADNTRAAEPHTVATDPAFDCFYVYPTVLLTGAPQMVDFSQAGVDLVNDPLQSQGARFNSMCRMYAPFYRQIGLSGGAPVEGSDPALGAQDVRDAFKYYLENLNQGRDFVLLGHSQGSAVLSNLVKEDIDNNPEVLAKMISAVLLGIDVAVPKGEVVGGAFQNVPLCTQPGQRGCVITYVSYASDDVPMEGDRFGADPSETEQAGCVNPATLSGNTGLFKSSYYQTQIANSTFAADTPLPDDIDTPFAVYHELFQGECVAENGFSYLKVTLMPSGDGDLRMPPWRTSAVEALGFGLHLMDYHIPMGDLLEAVAMQAAAQ